MAFGVTTSITPLKKFASEKRWRRRSHGAVSNDTCSLLRQLTSSSVLAFSTLAFEDLEWELPLVFCMPNTLPLMSGYYGCQ